MLHPAAAPTRVREESEARRRPENAMTRRASRAASRDDPVREWIRPMFRNSMSRQTSRPSTASAYCDVLYHSPTSVCLWRGLSLSKVCHGSTRVTQSSCLQGCHPITPLIFFDDAMVYVYHDPPAYGGGCGGYGGCISHFLIILS